MGKNSRNQTSTSKQINYTPTTDGKFNIEFVKLKINEFTPDYFESYIQGSCINNDVVQFILNELEFIDNKISENINHGFGRQFFQHKKKIILEYCATNGYNEILVKFNKKPQEDTPNQRPKVPCQEKKLSIPQLAIYCFVIKTSITKLNANELLKKYTNCTSVKCLLNNRISKTEQLTAISENATADTKKKNNLLVVKEWLSSTKNKKEIDTITSIITAFENNLKNKSTH